MTLLIGTWVSEHGYRIGQLSGVDLDRDTHAVHHILVRGGDGSEALERRAFATVPKDHFTGDIVLFPLLSGDPAVGDPNPLTLTGETRVRQGDRLVGRLSSMEIDPETGEIVAIRGRQHWWNRAFNAPGTQLDFSVRGEIRVPSVQRAA